MKQVRLLRTILCVAALFAASSLFAQKAEIKIANIKIEEQRTPAFRENMHGSAGAKNYWCRIDLEFDVLAAKNDWINEMEVRWYVAVLTDTAKPSFLAQTVSFADVKKEKKHYVCAYIKPKFFERYLQRKRVDISKVSAYVEIYVDGQCVAREVKTNKLPNQWWKMTDKMTAFPNELLPKSRTPFCDIDYDFFEHEIIK